MKNNLLAALALLIPFTVASHAHAQQYFAASAMFVSPSDSKYTFGDITGKFGLKGGAGASIAYGIRSQSGLAFEVDLAQRPTKINSLAFYSDVSAAGVRIPAGTYNLAVNPKLTSLSLMASMVQNIEGAFGGFASPYFGAGIGLASVTYEGFTVGDYTDPESSEMGPAFQIFGGVSLPVADAMDIRIGYKYFTVLDLEFGATETEAKTHNLEIGAVFKF
ncbi:MAG: outer membrane beta-barrel protein [Albidovulum sp.]|nr:outer membrane beta-barrel protein [Albidovulum sp.]